MAFQTSVTQKPGTVLFAGSISDLARHNIISRRNAESSANLPFGVGLVQDSSDTNGCKLPTNATARFLGVAVHAHQRNQSLASDGAVVPNNLVDILTSGHIYVLTETAVTTVATAAGQAVRMRIAGTGQKGAFRAGAVTGETVLVSGMRFISTGAIGDIVEVEVFGNVTLTAD